MVKGSLIMFLLLSSSSFGQSLYNLYLSKGQDYAQNRELEKALDYFDRGIKMYPDSLAFYNGKGIVLEGLGDLEGSLNQFTKMIELDSSSYWGYFNRARVYRIKKDYKEACDDYHSAYKLGYKDARIYFNNGCGYISDPHDENPPQPPPEEIIIEEIQER